MLDHGLIDRDRLVDRLVEAVRIPSVNPFDGDSGQDTGEARMAEWLTGQLDRLGYSVETQVPVPGRPNVWGTSPGGDAGVLALVAHLDTVGVANCDDPFSGAVRDGRVHGRGACDMKAALAAYLEVAEVVRESGRALAGRLMIVGLADEEFAMTGSAAFGSSGPAVDHAIVGEPTDLGICTSHLGQYAFPIRTFGRAVHSSIAEKGVNAIDHMAQVIAVIAAWRDDLASAEPHPRCGHGRVMAGVIRGGDMVSIVPDRCELEVDRRLLPGETSHEVRADLARRLDAVADTVADFTYEIGDPIVDAAPLATPSASPLVAAAQAVAGDRGLPTAVASFPAATDAPNLGVPAVVWGPGALAQAHSVDEYVEIDQLVEAAHLYLAVVEQLLG